MALAKPSIKKGQGLNPLRTQIASGRGYCIDCRRRLDVDNRSRRCLNRITCMAVASGAAFNVHVAA